jgi:DNA-binding response OmpR family regulator
MFQTPTFRWPKSTAESRPAGYPGTGDEVMSSSAGAPTGPRVLVVDDEEAILDFVELGLRYEGFDVELARDGPGALAAVSARRPDLILLDLNLPGLDGLDVCRRVRQVSDVTIIMLTARGDVDERVEGLEAGADDCLPKPFKFKELLARVRAVLRRRTSAAERILKFGDLELNRDAREVFLDGRPIHLTPRELDLLDVFMLHPRQVMDRFVRGDASRARATGGSGLGLAIASAIVEAHGGTIEIESAPGLGTMVTIGLPGGPHPRPPLPVRGRGGVWASG